MKIKIENNFSVDVKECNELEKITGLMFIFRKNKAKALSFSFKETTRMAIHSLFVFFPFLAVWMDEKNRINEIRIVKPFNFLVRPKKNFKTLVEIPLNKEYAEIVASMIDYRRKSQKV